MEVVIIVFPVVISATSESCCCFGMLVHWPLALVRKWTMGETGVKFDGGKLDLNRDVEAY